MSALALLAVLSASPSPFTFDDKFMFRAELLRRSGERPGSHPEAGRYEQSALWLSVRAGDVANDGLDLGTQLGIVFGLGIGVTPSESETSAPNVPLGLELSFDLPMRFFVASDPFPLMAVAMIGAKFGLGGAHWWSDSPRLELRGGLRLAAKLGEEARLELEVLASPFSFGGAPFDTRVHRFEHQWTLLAANDDFAVGAKLTRSDEGSRRAEGAIEVPSHSVGVGVVVEWRPE